MVNLKDWIKNWRETADDLSEGETADITMRRGREDYAVLSIRIYDPKTDGDRKVARTASRKFDNQVAMYSRRTRDSGLGRVITNRGVPRFILQRGHQALEWAAAVEEMTLGNLRAATREGDLEHSAINLRNSANVSREKIEQIAKSLDERIFDAEHEARVLRTELILAERALKQQGGSETTD